jgi:hypothetical protein
MKSQTRVAKACGRPRKFERPSRVITLTLPEDTIDMLSQINTDRAKAIVQAVEIATPPESETRSAVELIEVGSKTGMLTVPYCGYLHDIPSLKFIKIAANRFLVALSVGSTLSSVEITVSDELEKLADDDDKMRERQILKQLLIQLRTLRRSDRVNLFNVILVEMR